MCSTFFEVGMDLTVTAASKSMAVTSKQPNLYLDLSYCLVLLAATESVSTSIISELCIGWKQCIVLLSIKRTDPYPDLARESGERFSPQIVWLMVKEVPNGFIPHQACGKRSHTWMHYKDISYHQRK